MKMKTKAVLLSFVGATVLAFGLQSQPIFASTYAHKDFSNYSYTWNYKGYRRICRKIEVIPVPEETPEIIPEETPEVTPEVTPEIIPEETPEVIPEVTPEVTPEIIPEETPEVDTVSAFEAKVVELTNVERAKQGLPAFKVDSKLSEVARLKSQDIQDKGYFDHQSPTYGSPFDMMKQFGVSYRSAGENIAKGQRSPEEVVNGWMNSDGHRKNILGNFTHIGVGYAESGNVWTQMFISK